MRISFSFSILKSTWASWVLIFYYQLFKKKIYDVEIKIAFDVMKF